MEREAAVSDVLFPRFKPIKPFKDMIADIKLLEPRPHIEQQWAKDENGEWSPAAYFVYLGVPSPGWIRGPFDTHEEAIQVLKECAEQGKPDET